MIGEIPTQQPLARESREKGVRKQQAARIATSEPLSGVIYIYTAMCFRGPIYSFIP